MSLSLRINIVEGNVTKTIVFDPTTTVYDACKIIREKASEVNLGKHNEYGLYMTDDATNSGIWLEPARKLEYYILQDGYLLEYRKKMRTLRVKMLDGSVKTMLVDDSQIVQNLMVVICAKIGITNHDEYSLVLEDLENQENLDNRNYGTLTLKRKKEERQKDAVMDQLRKKVRTDDEVNWVDPSKTLREQGIDENETVLLRRKFFFSDQNIDSRDPVQLNLLYVQARDAILDGTHPVTHDKACEFAGIQCQIQFGNHVDSKHKPGFLDLKEFLPQSYMKVKGIEKKIFQEHKRHQSLSELDAKVMYTKIARALTTYGVTFFLVKEKMKGKNKLVPRLLGVTKDSVLRLDEKTKEILQTWPLTTVRRWGASANTFTLDFGDYADQYYSVQTTEADQIQQIIAGYIDIILKKKQAKDHFGIEGDEGSTMVEDSVSPHKATILQHESSKVGRVNSQSIAIPAVMRAASEGADGRIQQTKVTTVLSEPQKALVSTIESTQTKIEQSVIELESKAQFPELGSDNYSKKWKQVTLDTKKQNVGSQIAAMNAATAQVVTLTSGNSEEIDHNAVGAAINTIGTNLPEITKDVRMIAALMDDTNNGERLLDATRKLVTAFSDLLKAAEPESKEPRQTLLSAASRVGDASSQVLSTIGDDTHENKELQDMLLYLAKAVANTTAALVLNAKNIAATCDEQQVQNRVIGAATQCALATSQLVACAKVVAPTLHSTACQEQLTAAVREVAKAVENLVTVCSDNCFNDDLMYKLNESAAEVSRTLNDLLNHIKMVGPKKANESIQESSVEVIYTTTDKLTSASDSAEMIKQARVLGQATAQLIQSIKGEAEKQPVNSDMQKRLLAAAKNLADATARMVEAARQCANNPQNVSYQDSLRSTAEYLRDVTIVTSTTPALRARLVERVNECARRAVSTATQCIQAAQLSHQHNSNQSSQEQLINDTHELTQQIPPLVESINNTTESPQSPNHQVELMYVAEVFLHPATHFVQSSRAVLPTLHDSTVSQQLNSTTQQFNTDIIELRSAISKAQPACQGLGMNAAAQIIDDLKDEFNEFEKALEMHSLKPLPGDSAEKGTNQLVSSVNLIDQSVAQMLSATSQNNEFYTSQAARDTAQSLRGLTGAVRMVAATTGDRNVQMDLIRAGYNVVDHSSRLLEEAQTAVNANEGVTPTLQQAAKEVTRALEATIACLPGQRDVDVAITSIKEWSYTIDSGKFPVTDKSYGELQRELSSAASHLNDASSVVVHSAKVPSKLASSSKDFSSAYHELLQVSMEMAGQTPDYDTRGHMVHSLKNVSTVSSELLNTAKCFSADPNMPNGKNQLADAARAVTDSINQLLDVYTSATPGQADCENAIRNIQAMKHLLDNPSEPINDWSYYECLDAVTERSKILGEGMSGITASAKQSEHEKFSHCVKTVSGTICCLVEAAAQASYLVGISDSSSVAGRPGLVDQAQFARATQAIQKGVSILNTFTSKQDEVLNAATLIAKNTSALCNACRTASTKTTNPVAKVQFVQSAKDVANSTAHLVKEIKALDSKYSEENRIKCAEATKPLLDVVHNLRIYANSPEFVSVPAKISSQAREAQQPILDSGRKLIESSTGVINSSKNLVIMPKDPTTWQQFATHSKNFSDSIINLVSSIKNTAPGQIECDKADKLLNNCIHTIDRAYMDSVSQSMAPNRSATLQSFTQQVARAAAELTDTVEVLRQSAKYEAENIGHSVNQLAQYFEPLVHASIGAASNMTNSKQQEALLNQTKSVTECAMQFIYVTKDCGGNPKSINLHPEVEEAANGMKESLQELVANLETLSTQSGIVSGVIETLSRAMSRLSDNRASLILTDSDVSYVDFQTRMVECSKDIAKLAGEMSSKAGIEPQRLAPLSADLSHKYSQLASDSIGAAAASSNMEVSMKLRQVVLALGAACESLVKSGGECQFRRDDMALRDIADCARNVNEKVSRVLATLQSGSRGTQACINAASTVSGIIGDLDTTIMFATAGNLNPETETESFSDHRENILKTAKALVEDTKTLVAGAASSQEQLAVAAQNAVTTIVRLAEVVKFGAASLGSDNPDSQVMLINAVKDVASALGDLIHATKAASGKPINDPAMSHLKDSAKVMVTNVTSLLKTVKSVEDEHTRGTRALEATAEAIAQELKSLRLDSGARSNVTPEELIRITKDITKATAKSVAAGISNKQDDIIAAANISRRTISDMLIICKSASIHLAETLELKQRTMRAGEECAKQYRELLLTILQGNYTDAKQTLPLISRNIATSVTELVAVAELLKGSDWVDPEDPTVIAENELLGAAASIDAAAKKLANLRPRKTIQTNELDENMNFDEMILEAAKSIAAATSALVKAASAAQRELIDSGKVSGTPLTSSDDGQWSEGLISAARLVAAATHSLVESANALVQGLASEEKMISSAKQVASSTAQLLVACKVKAEGDTEATRRLQQAGSAVIRSIDNLVRAAQRAISVEEERSLVLNKRMVGGIAQEINARTEVLRIERQLEEARGKLTAIRQAKYKMKGGDASGEDTDGYISSNYDGVTSRLDSYYTNNRSHNNTYTSAESYDYLESPEKVHSLDRHRPNRINLQGSSDPYGTNQSYNSFAKTAPKFVSSPTHEPKYSPTSPKTTYDPPYSPKSYDSHYDQNKYGDHYGQIQEKTYSNTFGKPYRSFDSNMTYATDQFPSLSLKESQDPVDGYTTSEMNTNTVLIPGGYKTVTNKIESYHSGYQPMTYTASEKYYTTPSPKSSSFKNGSDYQSSYSNTVEFMNDAPTLKDSDTLEQKMLKKSVTQQITEKKTVSTVRSSKQETATKTFRLE
ncbi:PREDICTED: talin-2 isoform X2 [Nicrophorus vespilloides]|uniref:Talin-2 isoform X2 n=1 Tax=Nicrophorus vespilloides TaxID=110193 RepID=A0ABM1MJJ1_NICVS|nr:PREDICTED: talin-2 isoform X2 [Nicrophorus vespilloides]